MLGLRDLTDGTEISVGDEIAEADLTQSWRRRRRPSGTSGAMNLSADLHLRDKEVRYAVAPTSPSSRPDARPCSWRRPSGDLPAIGIRFCGFRILRDKEVRYAAARGRTDIAEL